MVNFSAFELIDLYCEMDVLVSEMNVNWMYIHVLVVLSACFRGHG